MISCKKITLTVLLIVIKLSAYSQCAMCKAVAEQSGTTAAKGINSGIIYLMIVPYVLIGTAGIVGYFVYRHYKKNKLPE